MTSYHRIVARHGPAWSKKRGGDLAMAVHRMGLHGGSHDRRPSTRARERRRRLRELVLGARP